jgi:hypothetical protein
VHKELLVRKELVVRKVLLELQEHKVQLAHKVHKELVVC